MDSAPASPGTTVEGATTADVMRILERGRACMLMVNVLWV
jgi:hypothetical protein